MPVRCAKCPMNTLDRVYTDQQLIVNGPGDVLVHRALCLATDLARKAVVGPCPVEEDATSEPNPACRNRAAKHVSYLMRLHEQGNDRGLDIATVPQADRDMLAEQGLLPYEEEQLTAASAFQEAAR